jgi:hypothetical protein
MTVAAELAGTVDAEVERLFETEPPESILARCESTLVFSRHHWLVFRGEYRLRADLKAQLGEVWSRGRDTWDDDDRALVLVLYTLAVARIGLEQLDDRVGVAELLAVLRTRTLSYLDALGQPRTAVDALGLVELAGRVAALRTEVERHMYRYSDIDGERWYRTEGLIPRSAVPLWVPTDAVRLVLARYGVDADGNLEDLLRSATRVCVSRHGESRELVRAVMGCALTDPLLRVDHVTITCARGDMLDTPEQMLSSAAFHTETLLRDGLRLDEYATQIGHDDESRLRRTVAARMLKLKRSATRNYFHPGCLMGQWVEKSADYMIFRNEDAHYKGHRSVGCSTGGRAAYSVTYERAGESRTLPPMMGDFRVVRLSHAPDDVFAAADLTHVIRYSQWLRAVLEETFAIGAVVTSRPEGGPTDNDG